MATTAPDFIVRDARESDRSAIRALTLRAYGDYATLMDPLAWSGLEAAVTSALDATDGAEQRIVADDHGTLIGSVMLFPAATQAYGALASSSSAPELRLLAVAHEARGRGVGRALVEECIRRAREGGATALGLHTSKSMAVAMDLYRRMGFERVPELDFQPPGAELVEGYRLRL
jgi:predicted N-acetyltransferase YhbS